jgi:hypothetical protein
MAAFYVKNVPGWERAARVLAGVGAAGYAVFSLPGPLGWLVAAAAVGIAMSGLVGFCPMCAMFGRRLGPRD